MERQFGYISQGFPLFLRTREMMFYLSLEIFGNSQVHQNFPSNGQRLDKGFFCEASPFLTI